MAIWIGRSGLGRQSCAPLANEDNERLKAVGASAAGERPGGEVAGPYHLRGCLRRAPADAQP
jgi:hypothetical protein